MDRYTLPKIVTIEARTKVSKSEKIIITTEKKSKEISEDFLQNFSFAIRRKFGRNIEKPLTDDHINSLNSIKYAYVDHGIWIIENSLDSIRNFYKQRVLDTGEYDILLEAFNKLYPNISLRDGDLINNRHNAIDRIISGVIKKPGDLLNIFKHDSVFGYSNYLVILEWCELQDL